MQTQNQTKKTNSVKVNVTVGNRFGSQDEENQSNEEEYRK